MCDADARVEMPAHVPLDATSLVRRDKIDVGDCRDSQADNLERRAAFDSHTRARRFRWGQSWARARDAKAARRAIALD